MTQYGWLNMTAAVESCHILSYLARTQGDKQHAHRKAQRASVGSNKFGRFTDCSKADKFSHILRVMGASPFAQLVATYLPT